ncbi:ATP-binding protein [Streptomyces avermitilis]|uniref:ATP-binding protein n=1 Tax=Streptomyces avermitilis TaxID=33903 RepID=UPI003F540F7F
MTLRVGRSVGRLRLPRVSLTAGFAAGGRAEGLATGAALDGEDGLAGRAASVHGVGDLAGVGLVRRLGRSLPPSRHRRWATAFGDATVAAAMLDRLLHRAAVAGIDGPSYRLRGHQNQAATIRAGVNARVSCHPRHHRGQTRDSTSLPFAYEILHAVGGLKVSPPTLRQAQARGQLTPAELVDRHPIADRAVRDVLVHYIAERSAALDYGSLVNQAQMLADLFWGDLERHHPGIASLNLPDTVAQEWKQRVRVLPDGRPRRTAHGVFLAVCSFYLNLLQWSMDDPARWAQWAAPCPISEADIRRYIKETRHRQARMQQRTRTLVPVVPQFVRAAEGRLHRATLLLESARSAKPGEEFTIEDRRYRRTGRERSNWRPTALFSTPADEPGTRFDAECEENNAF